MIYGSWDMECDGQNFLSLWTIFCPFTPPNNPKNQNIEKMKKTPGDIIILHMCTTDDNHMMNGSWDMERDGQNVLSFWTIFAIYHPKKPKKNQAPGDIIILHKCIKNHNHMLYCSWDIMCDRCNYYSSFWAIFLPFYPLNCLKNEN